MKCQLNTPAILAVHQNLYPTLDSLQDVLDLGASKMPINQWNEMVAILGCYHNTLLKVIKEQNNDTLN